MRMQNNRFGRLSSARKAHSWANVLQHPVDRILLFYSYYISLYYYIILFFLLFFFIYSWHRFPRLFGRRDTAIITLQYNNNNDKGHAGKIVRLSSTNPLNRGQLTRRTARRQERRHYIIIKIKTNFFFFLLCFIGHFFFLIFSLLWYLGWRHFMIHHRKIFRIP